jgi:hypothetical protein
MKRSPMRIFSESDEGDGRVVVTGHVVECLITGG